MTRDKKLVVGVVVLAALSGLAYRQFKLDDSKGKATAAQTELPEIKSPDDVDKISITNGDRGEVVLEKQGDKWMLTKPVKALAAQTSVKSLVENMKELKAKEVIASSADDALKKEYNLSPDKAVHVVSYKGGEKKADNWFGKAGSRGEMMMVEGKPAVYALPPNGTGSYSSYLYNKTASEWRDKEIWKFEDGNVINATIDNKNGKLSFTKGEKWAGTFKDKPIERFDEEKVKEFLRMFKNLNADDFADESKTAADLGLDTPESVITITLKDNAGKYALKVGKNSTGNARWAEKEGDPIHYAIGVTQAEWATADEKRFQKPLDGGASKDSSATAPKMPGHGMPGMPTMPGMPPGHP